jgi:hypothetical protein
MISLRLRLLIGVVIFMLMFGGGMSTAAADDEDPVVFLEAGEAYTFGGQIAFWAKYDFKVSPDSVVIFYKSTQDTRTSHHEALVSGSDVSFTSDLKLEPLIPFAEIEYWFVVRLSDGKEYTSPKSQFIYNDNRFDWRSAESVPFRVYWYDGDAVFGQTVLDAAQSGLKRIQDFLEIKETGQVEIYVYASGADMQSTYLLGGIEMIAGHANPELGVMVVSLPPGPDQRFEIERQVPHELTHILLYRLLGNRYGNLPVWLNEGLASMSESVTNPDYALILDDAYLNHKLLSISSLCSRFPGDAAGFYQAYAQSESFTRFLFRQYGATGLSALMTNYADGMDCERGIQTALGESLAHLDSQWQEDIFGKQQNTVGLVMPLPWIVLLVIVLLVPMLLAVFGRRHRLENPAPGDQRV